MGAARTSEAARRSARFEKRVRTLAEQWSPRARAALVRVGPHDVMADGRTRMLDAVGAGATVAIADAAFDCEIDAAREEDAPQWRSVGATLALDWMDARGGAARWARTLERVTTAAARNDACMLGVERIEALNGLSERGWTALGALGRGLRTSALGEAPVDTLEEGTHAWGAAVAQARLAALDAQTHINGHALADALARWPWPDAEPPVGTLALLGGTAPIERREAWAGADRIERQPARVRELLKNEGCNESARRLRAEIEDEGERMRRLIETRARCWLDARGCEEIPLTVVQEWWRESAHTSGSGRLRAPRPVACEGRVGWRVPYNNPAAVMAAANATLARETVAMIATWIKSATVRESGRAQARDRAGIASPWAGTRLGEGQEKELLQMASEARSQWSQRRYEATMQVLDWTRGGEGA